MSRKIRVLHIIKSLGRGGAETLLPETLKLHDKDRFEFHYIYFLPWKDQLVDAIFQAGGKVSCFSAKNNIQILLHYRRVIKYISDNEIDLIHCHLPWAGFVGRLVHKATRIPTIYTEHNKQERYHGLTYALNKFSFDWQSLVVAVSRDVETSIKKNINSGTPIEVILNGVNTDTFVRNHDAGLIIRKENGIPEDALVIGTIAVFRFQKRLIEWLEVAKNVSEQNENAYFIIVGDGPLKHEITEKRNALGLANKVIFAGLQTEVKPWLSAMDIYMMTSVFEGLPIALLEAMSMQCAVATTDAGGIKEVIRNEKDGLSLHVDNFQNLPDLIVRLEDQGYRSLLSQNARLRVMESFSLKTMVANLENVYLRLLS
jgi:glycosyltransferase involved in cell wall biosynthesis